MKCLKDLQRREKGLRLSTVVLGRVLRSTPERMDQNGAMSKIIEQRTSKGPTRTADQTAQYMLTKTTGVLGRAGCTELRLMGRAL